MISGGAHFFLPSPSPGPLSFFRASTYPKGYYVVLLSLIFLSHKIKDGGYNNKNIKLQLSPAKSTPALQIKDGGYNNDNIKKQLSPAQNTPALQATTRWTRPLSTLKSLTRYVTCRLFYFFFFGRGGGGERGRGECLLGSQNMTADAK